MISWLMAMCPITVGIANIGRLKMKSRTRIYAEKFIEVEKNP